MREYVWVCLRCLREYLVGGTDEGRRRSNFRIQRRVARSEVVGPLQLWVVGRLDSWGLSFLKGKGKGSGALVSICVDSLGNRYFKVLSVLGREKLGSEMGKGGL